jgi:hypothetical protein
MISWNAEAAANMLEKNGLHCHYRKSKSANFRVKGESPREISIALGRVDIVTAYLNAVSTGGHGFPTEGIDGVAIAQHYIKGHQGRSGARGISESVARQNPTLDPRSHDVLRLHVRDQDSLVRLLQWYSA